MVVEGIGILEKKYSILYKREIVEFLGAQINLLVQFDCVLTNDTVSEFQLMNYTFFKANTKSISNAVEDALTDYTNKLSVNKPSAANITSVVFDSDKSYILMDVSWDVEQGIAILFDDKNNIKIVEQDEIL